MNRFGTTGAVGPRYRKIYLIRHGTTSLNSEGGGVDRIRGWKNVPLSAKGREEAKELGEKLKDSGIGLIVASDLDRAAETAQAIAGTTGARVELTKLFRPWDLGEWTGQESQVIHPKIADFATKKPDAMVPGGESFNWFRYRVFQGLRAYMGAEPSQQMAIVAHHRNERLIQAWRAIGSPANGDIDFNVMFQRGARPAQAELVPIDLETLYGLVPAR